MIIEIEFRLNTSHQRIEIAKIKLVKWKIDQKMKLSNIVQKKEMKNKDQLKGLNIK